MRVLGFFGPVVVRFPAGLEEAGHHRVREDGIHKVAIARDLPRDEAAGVLVHELTHAAQAGQNGDAWLDRYYSSPERYEREAHLAADVLWRRVLLR